MSATSNAPLIDTLPRIGITIGDAAGIGPEIVLKSLSDQTLRQKLTPVVIGDDAFLRATAKALDLAITLKEFGSSGDPDAIELIDLKNLPGNIRPGEESAVTGAASGQFIEKAVELWRSGTIAAIATAPISKKALNSGGYDFPGHTEFLAHLTDTTDFAMSFFADKLRVVLLSTHLSLAEAIRLVTRENLVALIEFTSVNLSRLLSRPVKIAVAGLNPHASEGGMFGNEEADEMTPAVEHCRTNLGLDVSGPYSPDTIFLRGYRGEFDAVIACYHDQATIAVKSLSFGTAVNVTLGLPLIRTSVDHGTAVDIAGRGIADASSMTAAIKLAGELAIAASDRETLMVTKKKIEKGYVLLADDDPAILWLVRTLVEGEGFSVVTAMDGREALRILKSDRRVIAAIVDVMMPYIKGTDLVRFMQSSEKLRKIPVIMMTAEQSPKLPSKSFEAGAMAFLPKPFTNAQLRTMIRTFAKNFTPETSD